MKKLSAILLVVLIFTFALVSCTGGNHNKTTTTANKDDPTVDPPIHVHVEEIIPAVESTCTEKGLTEGKICSECGEVWVEQIEVPIISHTYDDDKDDECNICGNIRDISCKHNNIEILEAKESTCISAGFTEGQRCVDCEEIIINQSVVDPTGHNWLDANCTDPKICSKCRATEGFALGHTESDWIIDKEATELETGYKHIECIICNCLILEEVIPVVKSPSQGLYFSRNDDKTGYLVVGIGTCKDTDIIIPSTYKGLPVVGISERAFYHASKITSVTIPDTVTSIGNEAFIECESLVDIVIPDSVTTIGGGAFYKCSSLVDVTISESVTCIERCMFYECVSLTNINIPDSVVYIGNLAFYGCTSLTNVKMSNNIETIDSLAFIQCASLKNISIPDSIRQFGGTGEFIGGDPSFGLELQYNEYNDVLYIGNDNNPYLVCVKAKNKTITTCQIHEDAKIIQSAAFRNCESLQSITIPVSVINIGSQAFDGCVSLRDVYYLGDAVDWCSIKFNTNIHTFLTWNANLYFSGELVQELEIPNDVTSLGDALFYGCASLTSVKIPDSVTSIGKSTFSGCASLIDVEISNSMLNIGGGAFSGCVSIESISIPDSVVSIGSGAFSGCTTLEYIELPDSLCDIGSGTFRNCNSLESVTIPNSLTSIPNSLFRGCTSLELISIPNSIIEIGDEVFVGCTALEKITIPSSVLTIGNKMFMDCVALESVDFDMNSSLSSIGVSMFENCYNLSSVSMPNSIVNIYSSAFENCYSLTNITIPASVKKISDYAFAFCYSLIEVCNKSSLNIIKGDSNYGCVGYYAQHIISDETRTYIKYIGDFIFYDDGNNVYLIKYVGNNADVVLPRYDRVNTYEIYQYTFMYRDKITKVTIPNCVTAIGNNSFYNCTSLKEMMIPSSVTIIGKDVFAFCKSFDSCVFENPQNWFAASSLTATKWEKVSSLILSDPYEAASYFRSMSGYLKYIE